MSASGRKDKGTKADDYLVGGAFGAGAVLVVLPCVALYFGIDRIATHPAIGLPILAVFGIMILFGALALISTLFARLDMHDRNQALGLPEGSIRAAIALALIVLFAIISIMLYQAVSKSYVVDGLDRAAMEAMRQEAANSGNIIAVVPTCGAKPVAGCPPAELQFAIHLRLPPGGQESADLAKQLLILIGTLMTSVTSFYFASRALEPKREGTRDNGVSSNDDGDEEAPDPSASPVPHAMRDASENLVDGCDVEIKEADATKDEQLPPARGGVAS